MDIFFSTSKPISLRMTSFTRSSQWCFKFIDPNVWRTFTRFSSAKCGNGAGGKDLRTTLAEKVKSEQQRVKKFVTENGKKKIGDVLVSQIYGGMRDLPALLCETSLLDSEEGLKFRGFPIPECRKLLPKAECGEEPLPEGMFWLLMTGEMPTPEQAKMVTDEWNDKGALPDYVQKILDNLPQDLHPMTLFSIAIAALSMESEFASAYKKGVKKREYWKYSLEDAMILLAKIPNIAAYVFKKRFRREKGSNEIDKKLDWSANFARFLGYDNPHFDELLRLYLFVHSDHDSGNVSSHATHLVASALSDPFLAFAAGLNGLAGPLHGLANQEVILWINKMQKELGNDNPPAEKVKEYVHKTLKAGRVIPGYGHAVLRTTDPRYMAQQQFAEKYLPKYETYQLVKTIFEVVPPILQSLGKVKNPWPNVDAHSGVLLQYYGLKETEFYTVLFGVSRAIGVMSSITWHRALHIPIERPVSFTTDALMKIVKDQDDKGAKDDKNSKNSKCQ